MMPAATAVRIIASYTQPKWYRKPFVCNSESDLACEEDDKSYVPINFTDVTKIEFGTNTLGGLQATVRIRATNAQGRSGTYIWVMTSGKALDNETMTKILQAFTAMGAKVQ